MLQDLCTQLHSHIHSEYTLSDRTDRHWDQRPRDQVGCQGQQRIDTDQSWSQDHIYILHERVKQKAGYFKYFYNNVFLHNS